MEGTQKLKNTMNFLDIMLTNDVPLNFSDVKDYANRIIRPRYWYSIVGISSKEKRPLLVFLVCPALTVWPGLYIFAYQFNSSSHLIQCSLVQ